MKRTLFCWGRAGWQKANIPLELNSSAGIENSVQGQFSTGPCLLLVTGPSDLKDLGGRVFDMDRRFYSS
jgi:hypothetical protein